MRIPAFAPAAATTLAVLVTTHPHGLGLSPDALSYLGAADSLAHGGGLRVPIADWNQTPSSGPLSHFPPGYSALLALPIALGFGAVDAARWLQALLAGAIVWLAGALARSVCPTRSALAAVLLTAALLLVTPAWNQGVLLLLSEPLLLALLALAAWLMLYAPERVLLLGSVTACCALTRYAGVAAPLSAAAFIATRPTPARQRARDVLLSSTPPVLALALWRHWAGQFREYGLFTTGWDESFASALATACDWLAPWPLPLWLRAGCVALVIAAACALTRAELRRERAGASAKLELITLLRATTAIWASYTLVLVFSRLCADPDIPFDWRLLSPIIVSATWLMAAVIARCWPTSSLSVRAPLGAYLALWFAGSLSTSANTVREQMNQGIGYAAHTWQESGFARWLRGPGRDYELYTNNPAAVWLVGQHPGRMLPKPEEVDQLTDFASRVRGRPSVIIGFTEPFDPTLDPAELARQVAFVPIAQFENAAVWGPAEAQPSTPSAFNR